MSNDFYSIIEFSERMNVHPNTVRRAIKSGRISAVNFGSGKRGVYRIPCSEIERILLCDMRELINKIVEEKIRETNPS